MIRYLTPVTEVEARTVRCASCHWRPPFEGRGSVWIGRASLWSPAVCVCADCLIQGLAELLRAYPELERFYDDDENLPPRRPS